MSLISKGCVHGPLRWGEKTILENIEQRQVDPNVFGCAESSGDVGFPLALHTFIARRF